MTSGLARVSMPPLQRETRGGADRCEIDLRSAACCLLCRYNMYNMLGCSLHPLCSPTRQRQALAQRPQATHHMGKCMSTRVAVTARIITPICNSDEQKDSGSHMPAQARGSAAGQLTTATHAAQLRPPFRLRLRALQAATTTRIAHSLPASML